MPTGEITVSFPTTAQAAHAGLDLAGDVLGEGGPTYDETGTITSGWVAIRAAGPVDDAGPTGEAVLMHEIGHAVGLDHAAAAPPTPEIMAPETDDRTTTPSWGAGDTYALQSVGCV